MSSDTTTATVRIKRVPQTEKNLAILQYLDRSCFQEDTPFPVHEDTLLWLGYDEGLPVCFSALTYAYEKTGFLSRVGVLQQYAGLGLHRRMIRVRVNAAKRAGWTSLITYTSRHNAKSLNNLVRCGFKAYMPAADWGGDQAVYLHMSLE